MGTLHASALSDFLEDMLPSLCYPPCPPVGLLPSVQPGMLSLAASPPTTAILPLNSQAFNAMFPLAHAFVLLFLTCDMFRSYLPAKPPGPWKKSLDSYLSLHNPPEGLARWLYGKHLKASLSMYSYKCQDKKIKKGRRRNCVKTWDTSRCLYFRRIDFDLERTHQGGTSSFPEKNSSRVSRSLFSPCERGRLVHLQTWNWASVKYSPRPKRAPVHKTSFSFVSSLPGQHGEKRCHVSCTVALTSGNSFKSSSARFVLAGTSPKVIGYTSRFSCFSPESLFTVVLKFCCIFEPPGGSFQKFKCPAAPIPFK